MISRVRHEILSFSLVIALPVAIAAVFPYEAVGFKAEGKKADREPFAAFVVLSERQEAVALKAARASWRVSASDVRTAELQIEELPERPVSAVLGFGDRSPVSPVKALSYELPPYVPSSAAPAPRKLPLRSGPGKVPAFSKKELLGADGLL